MILFSLTKLGLVRIHPHPPRSERVFQIPVQIGLRLRLHKYIFISFSSKPQTFLCIFTWHLHENDQKRRAFSLKTFSKVHRFENGIVIMISLSCRRILFTQKFENDTTTTTNYSIYLDTQTIDFRRLLLFSIVFIVSV